MLALFIFFSMSMEFEEYMKLGSGPEIASPETVTFFFL
jgi:hypothetical protein